MLKRKYEAIGDKMKTYENVFKNAVPDNFPIIIRIDGKAWHSFTRHSEKPFDEDVINIMNHVALSLMPHIINVRLAYIQSDEISFLIYKKNEEAKYWFDNKIQKTVSVIAGLASAHATQFCYQNGLVEKLKIKTPPSFDARIFVLPEHEVINYFYWRQSDWTRNSVQMVARSLYSQKQLHGKGLEEMQNMIFSAGKNWNFLETSLKRGRCVIKINKKIENEHGVFDRNMWQIDNEIPIFVKNENYITKFLGEFHVDV